MPGLYYSPSRCLLEMFLGGITLKIKCKKCLIVLEAHNMDFHDVENYSGLQCGAGGTHVFVGVLE